METRPKADWCSLDTGQTEEDLTLHWVVGASVPMPTSPVNSTQEITTAERVGQGRRIRSNQSALQEEQSRLAFGKDFHLWQQCSTWWGYSWGTLRQVSWPELQLLLVLQSPEGLSPSLIWRGWLMPSSSFLYLCSSFLCFPSLHVLACSFQTFR